MTTWIAFWNIVKKDMQTYYLKPPNISWGIIFPVAWTIMFIIRSASVVDIRLMLPGVMALSILFGTTSMLAVTITFERRSRSFERLLLAPISVTALILAKTAGAIMFGIANAAVPLILAAQIVDLANVNWGFVLLGTLMSAVTSAFMGLLVAVSVKEVFEAQTVSNFFRFPMIFLCGLFLPVDSLPWALRPLSYLLPLTYSVDIMRLGITNQATMAPIVSMAALLFITGVMLVSSLANVRRRWLS